MRGDDAGQEVMAAASCTTLAAPSTSVTPYSWTMVSTPPAAAAGTVASAEAAARSATMSWGRLAYRSVMAPAHSASVLGS
ncbi:hypothetical protein [Streptomyces sp. V1I6]|uniref:hypothetical protein n=1 Tax=Streptomyces sp. V1I6 TaxID=3042273 RepID=UPI00278AAD8D|nr:hypothetical protein [Streptomyces sp. V1I6]MDQ0840348.1 hypothetical protein [Streptomyces sp. V1I6]